MQAVPFSTQLTVSYVLAGVWLGLAGWRLGVWVRSSRDALRWLPLVLLVSVLFSALVPHAPWQTNFHGFGRVAGVEDAGWWDRLGEGAVHGTGWIAAYRLLHGLSAGLLGAFGVDVLLSLAAPIGLAVWVREALDDDEAGLAAAAALVGAPIWIRLVPTVSPYVAVSVALAVGLGAVARWSRSQAPADGLLAVLSAMWLADLHAEMVLIGPAVLLAGGLAVARDGRWLRGSVAFAVALISVFSAVRLQAVDAWLGGAQGGLALRLLDGAGASPRLPVLRAVALVTAAAMAARALPAGGWAVPKRAAQLGVLAVLGVCAWGGWSSPSGYAPDAVRAEGFWAPWLYLHPWWHVAYTPPLWCWASVVGLVVLLASRPAQAWGVAVVVAGLIAFYATRHDAFATWVRTGLPASLGLAVLAGVGVAAGVRLARTAGLPGAPVVAALVGLAALSPYRHWLVYEFPMQQEFSLLDGLRVADDAAPIVLIGAGDASEAVDPAQHYARFRDYTRELLGASGRKRVHELGAFTATGAAPAWYVRSLGCFRAVLPEAGPAAGQVQTAVINGQRWWLPERGVDARVRPTEVVWREVHSAARRWDLDRFAPCWDQPEAQRCAVHGATGCEAWTCAPGAAPSGQPYLDPACAAFEAAWELEPVLRVPVAAGQTSQATSTILSPGVEMVLFRVVGRR